MQDIQLGVIEARFADIIWENEPVSSSELVRLCAEEFGWKRSTTFTVLKRLSLRSRSVVAESFGGSLPAFITAFTRGKPLSEAEKRDILRMIEGDD